MFELTKVSLDKLCSFEAKRIYSPEDNVIEVFHEAVEDKYKAWIEILQFCFLWIRRKLFNRILIWDFCINEWFADVFGVNFRFEVYAYFAYVFIVHLGQFLFNWFWLLLICAKLCKVKRDCLEMNYRWPQIELLNVLDFEYMFYHF